MRGCCKVDAGFLGKARLCLQGSIRLVLGGLLLAGFLANAAEVDKDKVQAIAIKPVDPAAALKVSYYRDVRPLLANHCIECHGADEPKGDYRMTSVAELLKSGKKQGPGIIPGKPDESPVVRYIRGELKPQMPKGNPVLTAEALHTIRLWIAAGAVDDTAEATANKQNELAAWEQFDPRKAETIAKAQLTAAEREALLNPGADLEKRFLARRQWRLSQLPPAPTPPSVKAQTFNPVDNFIVAKWQEKGLPEAAKEGALCSDEVFIRRVYLDIIGEVPTVPEVLQFLKDARPDRRNQLINALLSREDDYAANWTTFWEDLIASADSDIRGGILTRGNHKQWIYRSLIANKPYDLMVAELIDTTLPRARKPAEQKSFEQTFKVGFVRNDSVSVTVETAANVGQVFLGTSMKCAACHTHFDNPEWPQAKFTAFAGVFSEQKLELVRCEKKTGTFLAPALPFALPGAASELPANLEDRMVRTAQWLTDPFNPRFAKAFVNRIWKKCLGLGLVEPADEFRDDHQASHPELLEWLAQDFIRSGYDIKHLLRVILGSRTYQSAYDVKLADVYDPAHPYAPRYFHSPQLRKLSAEQLLDSINVVGIRQHITSRRLLFRKDSTVLTQVLGRPSSRNEVITSRSEELAVLQFLEMLNGPDYQNQIYRLPLIDLLAGEDNAAVTVESLYLAAMGRRPTADERQKGAEWLQPGLDKTKGQKSQAEEIVLFDDEMPGVFTTINKLEYVPWAWGNKDLQPVFSGQLSLRTKGDGKVQWQGANITPDMVVLNVTETFFAQVHPDIKSPPTSIWLRIQQDEGEYLAVWSNTPIVKSQDPLLVTVYAGELPKPGTWTRLEIPFRKLQLVNGPIKAISFGVTGGTAYWDRIGLIRSARSPRVPVVGDVLWALFSTPEFQYIR